MDISEKLRQDLNKALKEGETEQVATLRLLYDALNQAHIKKGKNTNFTKEDEISVLYSEAKKRKEAIQAYKNAQRHELAQKEKAELNVIKKYLPEPLSEEELETIVNRIIKETGAAGIQDMGRVMGKVMPQVKGRADGVHVKQIVQAQLAN